MTKSIQIESFGGPEVLKLKEINLPKLNPNEVLIKNKSIGLNFIDTYHRSGIYPIPLPSGIGLEAAGIIEDIGKNVNLFKIGDKVTHASMPIGAYSEQQILPQEKLVKVPNEISFEIASAITLKGMTCEYLLHRAYSVKKSDTILFHAAAGGLGQIFCQWARTIGCTIIGTVGSEEKIKIAKENGVNHVINYSKGVDVVYDGVGKKTFEGSLTCIKLRGMFITFGNASGPIKNIDVKKHMAPKAIFITRPSVLPYTATREELELSAETVFSTIKNNKININIFKKYQLSEARKAHEELESRILTGPSILIP